MPTADKTYTFRASGDLAPRVRAAFLTLSRLLEDETAAAGFDEAMAEFSITLIRYTRELESPGNQSELFRTTFEAFINAAEKLARDRDYVREYEQWAAEDEEGRLVREGALKASASRWAE
jgi:cell division septum initiation protein DivIVA